MPRIYVVYKVFEVYEVFKVSGVQGVYGIYVCDAWSVQGIWHVQYTVMCYTTIIIHHVA